MFRRLILCFALVAVCAAPATASILGNALTFNGRQDVITDESIGVIDDLDGDDLLSQGDLIQGVIRVANVVRDQGTGGTISFTNNVWGFYTFEVTNDPSVSGRVELGPAPAGNTAIDILAAAGVNTSLLGANKTGTDAQSVFAVLSSTSSSAVLTDFTAIGGFVNGGGIGGVLDSDWDAELVAGISSSADFHEIQVLLAGALSIPFLEAGTSVLGTPASVPIGPFAGAYSVVRDAFGSTTYLPTATFDLDATPHFSDVTTQPVGATISTLESGSSYLANAWHFADDGNFQINVAPEPTSVIAWVILTACVSFFGLRRGR
jgi:hypothetical protein